MVRSDARPTGDKEFAGRLPAPAFSVVQLDARPTGDKEVAGRLLTGQQHSFMEI